MGYNADIAEDGVEAIRMWREKNYDLILMDCLMPNMDGYEASVKIRQEEDTQGHIPIIALTANASDTDRQRCNQSGMDEVVTKPYRKHELEDVLDRWLHLIANMNSRTCSIDGCMTRPVSSPSRITVCVTCA
jgi:CheY-like chemotaxis protein